MLWTGSLEDWEGAKDVRLSKDGRAVTICPVGKDSEYSSQYFQGDVISVNETKSAVLFVNEDCNLCLFDLETKDSWMFNPTEHTGADLAEILAYAESYEVPLSLDSIYEAVLKPCVN